MTGIDIVQIDRVPLRESFIKRILTEDELREYEERLSEKRKQEYAAGRFAAKEAIFKATQDPAYLSYSILAGPGGKPYIKGHPEIDVSITHDAGIAAAIVLILP